MAQNEKKTRNQVPEEIKFKIFMDMMNSKEIFKKKTSEEIIKWIESKYKYSISKYTFMVWKRKHKLPCKSARIVSKAKDSRKNTERIRMLIVVIKNLCKEVGTKVPSELDRMLDCVEEELD